MDIIAEEIQYYKANRAAFISQHDGKHLVIKGQQVAGIYDTNTEAVQESARLHEPGTYIIEHPLLLK